MSTLARPLRVRGLVVLMLASLGGSIACTGGPTRPTFDDVSETGSIEAAGGHELIAIAPGHLEASLNVPSRPDGRFVVRPHVTFSAAGTAVVAVKEVRFSFLVDTDRVIKHGAFLVHGGDLRGGDVTQQYPLAFDLPIEFPDLRLRVGATFVDGAGATVAEEFVEAAIRMSMAR